MIFILKKLVFGILTSLITFTLSIGMTWAATHIFGRKAPAIESKPGVVLVASTDPRTEQYAVYSALLNEAFSKGTAVAVIRDHTLLDAKTEKEHLSRLESPDLDSDLLSDYLSALADPITLEPRFDTRVGYKLISEDAAQSILRGGSTEFNQFRKQYPGATGMIFFSRVGFNKQMTKALVAQGQYCGPGCASGRWVVLEKQGGIWKVKSTVMTLMS